MPQRSFAITLVAITLMLGATAPAGAEVGDALVVRGDVVNVRTGPSTANGVEMRVFRDQLVIERQRTGDWVEVEIAGTGGRRGWVHGFLLAEPGGRRLAEPLQPAPPAPEAEPAAVASTAQSPTTAPSKPAAPAPAPVAAVPPKPAAPAPAAVAAAPPKPAESPPAAVAVAAAMPATRPTGGPIEPLTEPESQGTSIELPNLAIAAGSTDTERTRRAAPEARVATLPEPASAAVILPIPPRPAAAPPEATTEASGPVAVARTVTPEAAPMVTAPASAPARATPALAVPSPAAPASTAPASTAVAALPPTAPPSSIEPAAAPVDPGLERFRESVTYLNTRAVAVAGVDLFTGVEAAGGGVVRVLTTDAWETIPPAGRESYLNALVDRWAASRPTSGPVQVQIVDTTGQVMIERGKP